MLQKFSDLLNVLGSVRGGWMAGSRITSAFLFLQQNACAVQTHMHIITLHHSTLAVLSFKFQWHFSQA
jgi:hypothetical protein